MVDEIPIENILTGFSAKIKDSEERMNLLKERLLLLNQTFINEQERINNEFSFIKDSMRLIKEDTETIKEGMEHIIKESTEFARKEELAILERYIKMWDPLKSILKEKKKNQGE